MHKQIAGWVAAAALSSLTGQALAQNEPVITTIPEEPAAEADSGPTKMTVALTQYYVGFTATYLKPDKNRAADVDYGNGFGLFYGQQFSTGLGLEFQLSADFFETGVNNGTDFYRQTLGVDIFWALNDRRTFTPFLLIGGGGARNDVYPDDRDDTLWYANAGVGFVTGPVGFDNLHFRGELRYIYDDFEEGSEDYRAGLGFEFPLWKHVEGEAPRDRVQVVEVFTGLNDSDGDGVIDERDRCPDTPAGQRVDGDGCVLPRVLALKGVNFEFNSSRLRPDSRKVLTDVRDILKRYPDMQVEIAGHTDNVGGDTYNLNLSQSRAKSVYNFLVEAGIPAPQMRVAGYGEAEPVASNDTEDGRELNRRVEMRILQ